MIRLGIFVVFAVAVGLGCVRLGERGARAVERLLADRVEIGLAALNLDWAEVQADGLMLGVYGHAPDLFARDLALETAQATAPLATIIDQMSVSLAPPPTREPVQIEILRDENGLTLTGSFYGERMRDRLLGALSRGAPGLEVHDLTGVNAARPGPGWGRELEIAVLAATQVPNAYVRIAPGEARIGGLARDAEHRRQVSTALIALAGDRVRLNLQLREPLVVAAPFVFSVVKDASGGMRLEVCAARDAGEEAVIEAALSRRGLEAAEARCPAALGGPSGDWAAAVLAGLQALAALPAGRFRLEYRTAELRGAVPTTEADLEPALTALAAALPPGYGLRGVLGAGAGGDASTAAGARYWMRVDRAENGTVVSGMVPDATSRRLIETYAAARFGQKRVTSVLSLAGDTVEPQDWQAAALVMIDALDGVMVGEAELASGRIAVTGTVPGPREARRLHELMAGEVPEGYAIETRLSVDLPAQVAAVPLSATRCAVVLNEAVGARPIVFAPGSAVFEPGSGAELDRLAKILRRCADGRIEIGGHTDAQGRSRAGRNAGAWCAAGPASRAWLWRGPASRNQRDRGEPGAEPAD